MFVQLHAELDPTLTLARAHQIAHRIIAAIEEAFPLAEIQVHQEPQGMGREDSWCAKAGLRGSEPDAKFPGRATGITDS